MMCVITKRSREAVNHFNSVQDNGKSIVINCLKGDCNIVGDAMRTYVVPAHCTNGMKAHRQWIRIWIIQWYWDMYLLSKASDLRGLSAATIFFLLAVSVKSRYPSKDASYNPRFWGLTKHWYIISCSYLIVVPAAKQNVNMMNRFYTHFCIMKIAFATFKSVALVTPFKIDYCGANYKKPLYRRVIARKT